MNAGNALEQVIQRNELLSVKKKVANGFVEKAEEASLTELYFTLKKAYPEDDIQTEERSLTENKNADRVWQVIPLDGAINLLYNIPHCAMSVTLFEKGKCKETVIYNPVTDDTANAVKGGGSFFNQHRIRFDKDLEPQQCMVLTNRPENDKALAPHLLATKNLSKQVIDVRSYGCPLLDLAYVAAGKADAYWQSGLSSFKTAAVELLINEASGQCLDFKAGRNHKENGQLVAGNLNNSAWISAQLKNIYNWFQDGTLRTIKRANQSPFFVGIIFCLTI